MYGNISEEVEVKASISNAWEIYSTLKATMIVQSKLSHIYGIDILEGDGDVGTTLKFTPRPDAFNYGHETLGILEPAFKERFVKIDHENMVKVAEIIEGGYLDLGFTSYRITLELMKKKNEDSSCILKVTIEYEANENDVPNVDASVITIKPLMSILAIVNDRIESNKI